MSTALSFKGKPPGQQEAGPEWGAFPAPHGPAPEHPLLSQGLRYFQILPVFYKRRGDSIEQPRGEGSVPLSRPWPGARSLLPSCRPAQRRGAGVSGQATWPGARGLCSLFNIPPQLCDGTSELLHLCARLLPARRGGSPGSPAAPTSPAPHTLDLHRGSAQRSAQLAWSSVPTTCQPLTCR